MTNPRQGFRAKRLYSERLVDRPHTVLTCTKKCGSHLAVELIHHRTPDGHVLAPTVAISSLPFITYMDVSPASKSVFQKIKVRLEDA